MVTMTPEIAAKLREPFKPAEIGKLPKITCKTCSNAPTKECGQHNRRSCKECGNYITTAHIHLDYVGHAEATSRILAVDPEWNWEPLVTDDKGLPYFDPDGGMWIRLTIAGVTRLGYGHADGKRGPDAVKVAIGDALRNAALRFGVAIDLWGASFEADAGKAEEPAQPQDDEGSRMLAEALSERIGKAETKEQLADIWQALKTADADGQLAADVGARLRMAWTARKDALFPPPPAEPAQAAEQGDEPAVPMIGKGHYARLNPLWKTLQYDGDAKRANRLQAMEVILKRPVTTSKELTAADAEMVIEGLKARIEFLRKQAAEKQAAEAQAVPA